MPDYESLGSEDVTRQKIIVLLIFGALYFLLFFGLTGATSDYRTIIYYILFTFIGGFVWIIVDLVMKKKEKPLETVVHEKNEGLGSLKW